MLSAQKHLPAMIGDDFNAGSFKSELWDNITGGDIRTAFEGNISSLFFSGAGRRFAQTRPLNTQASKSFEFDLIYGDGVNGWQATTFPVSLEYSALQTKPTPFSKGSKNSASLGSEQHL